MTRLLIASLTGLIAGLSAPPQAPVDPAADRVAVVVNSSGPGGAARLQAGRADAAARGAVLRAPRTLHDQLSVTAMLAAQGYTTIVGHGIDERTAIAPLGDDVRYVSGRSNTVSNP